MEISTETKKRLLDELHTLRLQYSEMVILGNLETALILKYQIAGFKTALKILGCTY